MKPLLEFRNTCLRLSQLDRPILSDINYQINTGDFIILLGSNGSGKSSLLKLIDQRYKNYSGDILFNNKSLSDYSHFELSRDITSISQNTQDSLFNSLTILENYLLVKKQKQPCLSIKKEKEFLTKYLTDYNINLPSRLDQKVESLSGGEKQSLILALQVLYPPKILLLDEHTSALDPLTAANLMKKTHEIINSQKITCILTTHDLKIAAKYGNRILFLRQGSIHHAFDNHNNALSQKVLLDECYN